MTGLSRSRAAGLWGQSPCAGTGTGGPPAVGVVSGPAHGPPCGSRKLTDTGHPGRRVPGWDTGSQVEEREPQRVLQPRGSLQPGPACMIAPDKVQPELAACAALDTAHGGMLPSTDRLHRRPLAGWCTPELLPLLGPPGTVPQSGGALSPQPAWWVPPRTIPTKTGCPVPPPSPVWDEEGDPADSMVPGVGRLNSDKSASSVQALQPLWGRSTLEHSFPSIHAANPW
uniref:Uncharacterized protein n=1 Tax=Rangifer tarandus platyrhynchus TaxID=3082113 RepID=A0ACB0F5N8_RANTA|nr:unnamed protein product [Rangifer tarandus platyrhynchus]